MDSDGEKYRQAVGEFIIDNRGIILWTIKRYRSRILQAGINFDDLEQESSILMMRLIRDYDKNREGKFSTYAVSSIKGLILKELGKKRREPKMVDIQKRFERDNGKDNYIETAVADKSSDLENSVIKQNQREFVLQVLESEMSEECATILDLIFGIKGKAFTVRDISEILNLSREKVKDTYLRSLRILKTQFLQISHKECIMMRELFGN